MIYEASRGRYITKILTTTTIVLVLFLFINVAHAHSINTLSDNSTEKNLTFESTGSQTIYLKIPTNADVTVGGWM